MIKNPQPTGKKCYLNADASGRALRRYALKDKDNNSLSKKKKFWEL